MKDRIVAFIKKWIAEHKGLDVDSLDAEEHLFQSGYLDSLGLFRLIFDVESEFDVEFDQDKLFASGATTIDALAEAMTAFFVTEAQ